MNTSLAFSYNVFASIFINTITPILVYIIEFVPRPGGTVVRVSCLSPGGCKFETQLRRTFFPAYFRLSPLLKHVRKVVGGFGKKIVLEQV